MNNDQQQRDAMSDTQRRRKLPSVPNCENCHIARDYATFRERTEERLTAGDLRMASNEAAVARIEGTVASIPGLIDAKFDSLILVMKTRDSVAAWSRSGKDQDKTPSGKPSEIKLPGGFSWSGPAAVLSRVVGPVLIAVVMFGAAMLGAYLVIKYMPGVAAK